MCSILHVIYLLVLFLLWGGVFMPKCFSPPRGGKYIYFLLKSCVLYFIECFVKSAPILNRSQKQHGGGVPGIDVYLWSVVYSVSGLKFIVRKKDSNSLPEQVFLTLILIAWLASIHEVRNAIEHHYMLHLLNLTGQFKINCMCTNSYITAVWVMVPSERVVMTLKDSNWKIVYIPPSWLWCSTNCCL